jgi:hypothetical protein
MGRDQSFYSIEATLDTFATEHRCAIHVAEVAGVSVGRSLSCGEYFLKNPNA